MFYNIYTKRGEELVERNVPKHLVYEVVNSKLILSGKTPQDPELWCIIKDDHGNEFKLDEF